MSFEMHLERRINVSQLTELKRGSFQAEGIVQEHTEKPMWFRVFRELEMVRNRRLGKGDDRRCRWGR